MTLAKTDKGALYKFRSWQDNYHWWKINPKLSQTSKSYPMSGPSQKSKLNNHQTDPGTDQNWNVDCPAQAIRPQFSRERTLLTSCCCCWLSMISTRASTLLLLQCPHTSDSSHSFARPASMIFKIWIVRAWKIHSCDPKLCSFNRPCPPTPIEWT